jgi:3-hydroxy-3-methylglutaryl CoA synthase
MQRNEVEIPENGVSPTVVVFSYGSGAASAMFRLRVHGLPQLGAPGICTANAASSAATSNPRDVFEYLDTRQRFSPAEYIDVIEAYSGTYAVFPFTPERMGARVSGAWYLKTVDEYGRRDYVKEEQDV